MERPRRLAVRHLGGERDRCLLLGLLVHVAPPTLTVAGVAGLGAYTTFSSFARDVVALSEVRQFLLAVVYVRDDLRVRDHRRGSGRSPCAPS